MKTKASIKFGLVDVTAKEDSNLQVNDKQDFVDILDLKKEDLEEIKYATCEKNQFSLDGTFELMPEILDNMGWWSNEMSDENGQFVTPLVLEINFTKETHNSLGLTFIFSKSGDYCNNLNLKFYDANNNLISNKDFQPNSYRYVCKNIVENYKKIVVTFYSTKNPFRYLKIYKILYGAEKVFEGDNLKSASILEEIDLLSSEISINTLDFNVYSEDDEFNILNPQGVYRQLQQRQKLEVTETKLKENKNINMGTFYLDTWKNQKSKLMKFTAIDLIGLMDKTDFLGGMYFNMDFEDIVDEIMESANFRTEDYEIQEDLKNIKITGYLPICTHREALQQVIFAIGAVADCSRGKKLKIYKVHNIGIATKMERSNISHGTEEISQNELVTGVSVIAHNYKKNTELDEIVKQEMLKGHNKIIFNEPVCDLECIGGSIIESNCNYAVINCNENKEVTIKGHKYIDILQTYLVEVENLRPEEKQNTLKIESAYFVNTNNAVDVGKRVLNYYQKTYTTRFAYILKEEALTEKVQVQEGYEQNIEGNITKLDINLTGGFRANVELHAKLKENDTNG